MGTSVRTVFPAVMFLALVVTVRGYPTEQQQQKASTDCQSAEDCEIGECCVIGMMRYSIPQCMPMGQMEDFCLEDGLPENRTLYYPNGKQVDVFDVYTHVCPCDFGFQCVDNSCAQSDIYGSNYIY